MNLLYFVERKFEFPVERLWEAWTKSAELEKWYSPIFLSVIPGSVTSEPVVGGTWAVGVDVSANGFNAYFWGSYQEVLENQKLVHDLNYSQDELEFALREPSPDAHRIEIDFQDLDGSCTVRFSQFGQMDQEQAEASREGMESYFDNLETHLNSSSQ
jgi:uncharacterized protein YndB with AHSA1/START domain